MDLMGLDNYENTKLTKRCEWNGKQKTPRLYDILVTLRRLISSLLDFSSFPDLKR